ncbi:hypothetical protein Q2T40_12140 [Winogradskyella maritima]|uniref:DUF2147 domain-containing protein n=1 Tax=Winogradskyella maritima TaxID=1517766 RepID=A0ABV8ALB8_9FLAO|nr:hypothetical protein [Winogradskyella maritima]
MKLILVVVSALLFAISGAQSQSQFIGKWDVVLRSPDRKITLKKNNRYDNNKYEQYFYFKESGEFFNGFYVQRIRCGNDSRLWKKQNKSWNWSSDENILTTISKF